MKLKLSRLKRLFKSYPCIKQYDETDCGAACLATIAKYYDLELPLTKLRNIAGTDKKGTNAFGLMKAARETGFETKIVKGNSEELKEEELPSPFIAHVNRNGLLHYVVV